MGNILHHNTCTVYLFLTCLTKVMTNIFGEPDYKNMLYGGVWKHVILNPPDVALEVIQASKHLFPFIKSQLPAAVSDDLSMMCLSKIDLWYSKTDLFPVSITQFVTSSNGHGQHPISVPLSFGSTYNFQVIFSGNISFVHFITLTKTIHTEQFYVYTHIFFRIHKAKYTDVCGNVFPHASVPSNLHILSNLGRNKGLEILSEEECISEAVQRGSLQLDKGDDYYSLDGHEKQHVEYLSESEQLSSQNVLKVMTYNIWNFNTYQQNTLYTQRMNRISQVLKEAKPDIVAFQEVRLETPLGGNLGPSQMDHLMSLLPHHQFVYQPAQMHANSLEQGRTEEGVAIFSRFPIIHHDYLLLFRNQSNSADKNQRVCLHAVIQVPSFGKVHIFNTHFSLSHEAREASVKQIHEYIKYYGDNLVIFLGDLNGTPEEKAIRMLTDECEMLDVWNILYPGKDGYTFSCVEEQLSKRIDYIFMNKLVDVTVQKVEVVPDKTKFDAASDHRAVMASFASKRTL